MGALVVQLRHDGNNPGIGIRGDVIRDDALSPDGQADADDFAVQRLVQRFGRNFHRLAKRDRANLCLIDLDFRDHRADVADLHQAVFANPFTGRDMDVQDRPGDRGRDLALAEFAARALKLKIGGLKVASGDRDLGLSLDVVVFVTRQGRPRSGGGLPRLRLDGCRLIEIGLRNHTFLE